MRCKWIWIGYQTSWKSKKTKKVTSRLNFHRYLPNSGYNPLIIEQNRSIKSCEEDDDKISKSSEKNVEEEASNNVDHSEKEVENGVDAEEERELEELMKSIEIGVIPPTTVSSTQATDNTSEISQKSGVLIDFEVNEEPPPPIQETTKTEIVETVEEVEKPPIEIVEVEAAPLIDIYDECDDDEAQIQLVVRSLVDRVVTALENDINGAQNENEQIFSNGKNGLITTIYS